MSTKRSLADLAAAFSTKATEQSSDNQRWKMFFPFWKAEPDTVTTVRFLPDANEQNPLGFFVENVTHELNINGRRTTVPCLKMYEEDCPICNASANFYNEKSPDFDKVLGKQFYKKKSYIAQVLINDSPVEHDKTKAVHLVELGPQIFKLIQAAFQSGDLEENPSELKGGYNFRIRKTLTGDKQNTYVTSSFTPKQSDVSDDVIEKIILNDLSEFRVPRMDASTIQMMLSSALTGIEHGAPTHNESAAQNSAPVSKSHDEDDANPEKTTAPESKSGGLSVVERLRRQAAAAKAQQGE